MFINSVTKKLFGPKNIDGTWPAGVSMVGPKGDQGLTGLTGAQGPIGLTGAQGPIGLTGLTGAQGPIGLTGATGPQGPGGASGGSGPAGAAGPAGPAGPAGITAPVVTGADCIPPATSCTYKIGDTGPGGGSIFFVDYFDQYAGFNYLEAAPQGWGNGIAVSAGEGETTGSTTVDPLMKWCSDTTTLLGLGAWSYSGVGKGATNTSTADTTCAGGAIQAAADYGGGSQTDWFLPSIGEAMLMYTNLRQAGVGGFVASTYWSSSESLASIAWFQSFLLGYQYSSFKFDLYYVRPVRRF
jgi:hypothetical protein